MWYFSTASLAFENENSKLIKIQQQTLNNDRHFEFILIQSSTYTSPYPSKEKLGWS